jgi:hypothetical protein
MKKTYIITGITVLVLIAAAIAIVLYSKKTVPMQELAAGGDTVMAPVHSSTENNVRVDKNTDRDGTRKTLVSGYTVSMGVEVNKFEAREKLLDLLHAQSDFSSKAYSSKLGNFLKGYEFSDLSRDKSKALVIQIIGHDSAETEYFNKLVLLDVNTGEYKLLIELPGSGKIFSAKFNGKGDIYIGTVANSTEQYRNVIVSPKIY